MPAIPARFPAYFLEKAQFLISRIYVPQIHLDLRFDHKLDPARLKKALRLAMDREPVLGCRFVAGTFRAFWERLGQDELDSAELLQELAAGEEEGEGLAHDFLASSLDAVRGPQLKALLLHEEEGDRLIIKINHQVADAAGTKDLGYLVAEIYRNLGEDPGYRPEPGLGARSLWQVAARLSLWRLVKIFFRFFAEFYRLVFPIRNTVFPSGSEASGKVRFSFRRFSPERGARLAAFARERGATLNDLFVAGLFKAYSLMAKGEQGKKPRMVCTVDLRRYLPGRKAGALCNLSGFFVPRLSAPPGEDFEKTLKEVKEHIDGCKKRDIGLSFFLVDSALAWPAPFALLRLPMDRLVKNARKSVNFPPALTNLGIVEEQALDFGGFRPVRGEALAPPTGPPFFALGLSGFKGSLTLSTGYDPAAISSEQVEKLFERLDLILPA